MSNPVIIKVAEKPNTIHSDNNKPSNTTDLPSNDNHPYSHMHVAIAINDTNTTNASTDLAPGFRNLSTSYSKKHYSHSRHNSKSNIKAPHHHNHNHNHNNGSKTHSRRCSFDNVPKISNHNRNKSTDDLNHYADIIKKLNGEINENNSWSCSFCKAINITTARHCFYCNEIRPNISTSQQQQQVNNASKVVGDSSNNVNKTIDKVTDISMWNCTICNTNNMRRTEYCVNCDTKNPNPTVYRPSSRRPSIDENNTINNNHHHHHHHHHDPDHNHNYCCGLHYSICGLGPHKFHYGIKFLMRSLFKIMFLAVCVYITWIGVTSLDKQCDQPLAPFLIAIGSLCGFSTIITWTPCCLRYRWREGRNLPVLVTFYIIITCTNIVGSIFTFQSSSQDTVCDPTLYQVSYIICICYWSIGVAFVGFIGIIAAIYSKCKTNPQN